MAKRKVINGANSSGSYFNNTPSNTIFTFGDFSLTTNLENRKYVDYSNKLSSFVKEVSLDTIGITTSQSESIEMKNNNVILNLDNTNMNTFIRFGSAYEYFRSCILNVIKDYPGSLYLTNNSNNQTFYDYQYNNTINEATFKVYLNAIVNNFGIIYNQGNTTVLDNNELKNLNLSYEQYVIWMKNDSNTVGYPIIGYTGNSVNRNYLTVKVTGNPFSSNNRINYHIKPNTNAFETYRFNLNEYEKYFVSNRTPNGFVFNLKEPLLNENGDIIYNETQMLWNTFDGYNLEINGVTYQQFLQSLLTIGSKYDAVKTDLIARFLSPSSIKTYDLTENGKITKLLRLYGREFDQLRVFIDSLVNINKISYNKINNIPDMLIKNMSKTFGWNHFSLLNEDELVKNFLSIDDNERNLKTDLMPSEIDIELWRRILINTNYFWKTKGTRESIKSMFLLIGIPEPFINITEYVYTVEGKINPNTVKLTASDFPSNSLPYDINGYPKAPVETNSFYFQTSGDTDNGQTYMNVFRKAGFNLKRVIDNKKMWGQDGVSLRTDDTMPQYLQQDSRLVLNTKEVDISLDTSRGIEFDVYEYLKKDYIINSSGYTLPYSFVNLSLNYEGSENVFPLPSNYVSDNVMGSLEVRFNGILLNGPNINDNEDTLINTDYTIDETTKTFTILNNNYAVNNSNRRDVIHATFIYSGNTSSITDVSVRYVLTRINANLTGTKIELPGQPKGDVQLTINGISLTKGTPQFSADYIVDYDNNQIIIQNADLILYLIENPEVQIAYVDVVGSNDIYARNEIYRIDSLNSNKLYYNVSANKYVYRLNYKTTNASDIKILIDGISLEPNKDYSLNNQNTYEIFLPNTLRYGMVISVFYMVGGNTIFHPIVHDIYGLGDITNLSFIEFIEVATRKLINVKNRKTISDFCGGWYPSLLNFYVEYLKRSKLEQNNPLLSNGYTYNNLYSFLSKYNTFFHKFVDQLLPATIILRKGGLLVRNTIFTQQKFMYRRGVNVEIDGSLIDNRDKHLYKYLGDDGSIFKILQRMLYVETLPAAVLDNIIYTGGFNIRGINEITSYGIQYRKLEIVYEGFNEYPSETWGAWSEMLINDTLNEDFFEMEITLEYNSTYQYRAVVNSGGYNYLGELLEITILTESIPSTIKTSFGYPLSNGIISGGYDFINYQNSSSYGMQYRCIGNINDTVFNVDNNMFNVDYNISENNLIISGDTWNSYEVLKNPNINWLTTSQPTVLSPTGVSTSIFVNKNMGYEREAVLCYTPLAGRTKYVTIRQDSGFATKNQVYFSPISTDKTELSDTEIVSLNVNNVGIDDCYGLTLGWYTMHPKSTIDLNHTINITCNNDLIFTHNTLNKTAKYNAGLIPMFNIKHGDDVEIMVNSSAESTGSVSSVTSVYISNVVSIVGEFEVGDPNNTMVSVKADVGTN